MILFFALFLISAFTSRSPLQIALNIYDFFFFFLHFST